MTRARRAQTVWTLAGACLLLQLAALHTGWLNAFFFRYHRTLHPRRGLLPL